MPNTYFQFKKFRIDQDRTAMKVTTEACILGAWVDENPAPKRILDIGTGTGLLALMLAQKFLQAEINAVEIDQEAHAQAQENFQNSPWAARLKAFNKPIQGYDPGKKYNLIISNPPFFHKSLLSGNKASNDAKHAIGLSQHDLIHSIDQYSTNEGSFYVLYPEREANQFAELASKSDFFLERKLLIYNQQQMPAFRIIQKFVKAQTTLTEEELIIKSASGSYTEKFKRLLEPYYLYL